MLDSGVGIAVQNPLAMLWTCVRECGKFAMLIGQILQAANLPLTIVLYLDGITPSDGLTKIDERKLTAVYWSFLEFGPSLLSIEEVWFCLTCTRLSVTNNLDGQISNLLAEIVSRYFCNSEGKDLRTRGDMLPLASPLLLTAAIGVGDEPALHDAILCKGHAGFRCCALCDVVLRKLYTRRMRGVSASHACLDWE